MKGEKDAERNLMLVAETSSGTPGGADSLKWKAGVKREFTIMKAKVKLELSSNVQYCKLEFSSSLKVQRIASGHPVGQEDQRLK